MKNTNLIMMELMRCSATGTNPGTDLLGSVKKEMLPRMFTLAYHHDLVHLLGDVLDKNGVLENDEIATKYRSFVLEAIYRYEKIEFEFERICKNFEENLIDFMPLKGSIIRSLYAKPWLRTSSDADILVKEADLKRAEELLIKIGFLKTHESSHDVTYTYGEGVIIELHFSLSEINEGEVIGQMLSDVWKYAKVKDGWKHQYALDDNFFYFYHIAHTAKHFSMGGCGIKPILDLHILQNTKNYDNHEIKRLLKQSGLERFDFALRSLSEVWFSGKPHDEVTLAMEEFILSGGVYGTESQLLLLKKRRVGGKIRYIFSRIFVTRRELEYEYPTLKKHSVLLPFFQVVRWVKFILKGDKKHSKDRYEIIKNISEENIQKVDNLFNKIGL